VIRQDKIKKIENKQVSLLVGYWFGKRNQKILQTYLFLILLLLLLLILLLLFYFCKSKQIKLGEKGLRADNDGIV